MMYILVQENNKSPSHKREGFLFGNAEEFYRINLLLYIKNMNNEQKKFFL